MSVEPLDIGAEAPSFDLPGVDGSDYALADFDADALVVIFTCNHCPVAQAYEERIVTLQGDYQGDAQVVAINPNESENYPEDSFENMVERADEHDFNFPYLRDASQEVAKAYGAECTPHAFVFDRDRTLVYQGAIDDDREGDDIDEQYVRDAIDAILAGEPYPRETVSPMGCSIKWREDALA